jgi:two-component system response regulator WspF
MRIAIVNDMVMAVEAMRRTLERAPGHELAWVARDGAEAVTRCAQDKPDLVLMDLVMPRMDGVEATRRIMAQSPCAIMVVTADVQRLSAKVFEALGAGALDAVDTPVMEQQGSEIVSEKFLVKIQTMNRLIRRGPVPNALLSLKPQRMSDSTERQLIAIGASAGGPPALARVLASLPADFPAAVVVVQHVDVRFAGSLAAWLDSRTRLEVRLAEEGDRPRPGLVLLAGMENHLIFVDPRNLGYTSQPMDYAYRPSIDVFFRSVLRFWHGEVVGVLLTGMGNDGAGGLKLLHDAGHHTIVQDRATSAVYGMPKAAMELRAATDTLPINLIGPRLLALVAR